MNYANLKMYIIGFIIVWIFCFSGLSFYYSNLSDKTSESSTNEKKKYKNMSIIFGVLSIIPMSLAVLAVILGIGGSFFMKPK